MESRRPIKKIALVILSILVCALFAGAILLHHFWPFTEGSVRSRLAETLSANVKFGSFHEKYFPPGCIAENVSFQRNGSGPPLISIRRLTIRSSLLRLLGHRISLLRAEGMHVTLARSDFRETKVRTNKRLWTSLLLMTPCWKFPNTDEITLYDLFSTNSNSITWEEPTLSSLQHCSITLCRRA